MAAKKTTRKELLNEPDEFITISTRVATYVRQNRRSAGYGAVAFLAAVLAAILVHGYFKQRNLMSHELFEKAYQQYAIVTLSEKDVPKDKLETLFKEFDLIARDYGSLLAGEKALLYSAHLLYRMKDYQGALDRYAKMKSTSLVRQGLGSLVTYNLAMTRLAMKEYEAAKELFEQLAKDNESPYQREACASVAAIYEAMGKNKEAVQAYRQYLKMFPQAPDAPYVRARIAEISGSG